MIKAKPILMSTSMVQANRAGRKTQTRRVIKEPMYYGCLTGDCPHWSQAECDTAMVVACPYGLPGDVLWVRETWWQHPFTGKYSYYADAHDPALKWKPSIHMPKRASRMTLEIMSTRAEPLHKLSRADAAAEGVCFPLDKPLPAWCKPDRWPEENYQALWDSINGKGEYAWAHNPWVWVIEYTPWAINIEDYLRDYAKGAA